MLDFIIGNFFYFLPSFMIKEAAKQSAVGYDRSKIQFLYFLLNALDLGHGLHFIFINMMELHSLSLLRYAG